MMTASKSRRSKLRHSPELVIHAPGVTYLPASMGGGLVKEYAELEAVSGRLWRYSCVYVNPLIFAGDNGRVLGYDNAHGHRHRHFMGKITPEPFSSWRQISEKFDREWREIAEEFVEGRL